MIELPEAIVISNQLNKAVKGKKIKNVIVGMSPHKFLWFTGNPELYNEMLQDKTIEKAVNLSGRIEIIIEDMLFNIQDGVNLRYYEDEEKRPKKHQLLIEFYDKTFLVATVSMYGGIGCFGKNEDIDNFYYNSAKNALSPLSEKFDFDYFKKTLFDEKSLKMSAKAFLATGQRIPGLGNGVLQDILLNAKIHPKRKMNTLSENEIKKLFQSLKTTLDEMVLNGGRDIERDLYGNSGNYITKLSKNNVAGICPDCGGNVRKENYLGGSIYYCEKCQKI